MTKVRNGFYGHEGLFPLGLVNGQSQGEEAPAESAEEFDPSKALVSELDAYGKDIDGYPVNALKPEKVAFLQEHLSPEEDEAAAETPDEGDSEVAETGDEPESTDDDTEIVDLTDNTDTEES